MTQATFPNALATAQDGGAVTRPLPFVKGEGAQAPAPVAVTPTPPVQPIPNYTNMPPVAPAAPTNYSPGYSPGYSANVHATRPYHACNHYGPNWKNGGTLIVADKIAELERRSDLALIVDCSEADPRAPRNPQLLVPHGFEALLAHYAPTPRVQIPWPDYGVPRVGLSFWQALADLLPDGKVGFGCTGGHGRTGTALTAIRMVIWSEPFLEALAKVRKDYCEDAVETMGQRLYLRDLGVALGTTPKDSATDLPRTAAQVADETKYGSARTGGYQSWKQERDAARDDTFASVTLGEDAHESKWERGARISKRQAKRLRKKQEREARKLIGRGAALAPGTSYSVRLSQDDVERAQAVLDVMNEAAYEAEQANAGLDQYQWRDELDAHAEAALEAELEAEERAFAESYNKVGMA